MRVKIVVKEHNKTIQSGFVFGPLDPKFTLRSQLLTEEGGWGGGGDAQTKYRLRYGLDIFPENNPI